MLTRHHRIVVSPASTMKEKPLQYRVRGTPVPTTRTRGTRHEDQITFSCSCPTVSDGPSDWCPRLVAVGLRVFPHTADQFVPRLDRDAPHPLLRALNAGGPRQDPRSTAREGQPQRRRTHRVGRGSCRYPCRIRGLHVRIHIGSPRRSFLRRHEHFGRFRT